MTVEQKIADMQQASVEQTQASQALADEVAGKMGEIDAKSAESQQKIDDFIGSDFANRVNGVKDIIVYVDPVFGADTNNGSVENASIKTSERLNELVGQSKFDTVKVYLRKGTEFNLMHMIYASIEVRIFSWAGVEPDAARPILRQGKSRQSGFGSPSIFLNGVDCFTYAASEGEQLPDVYDSRALTNGCRRFTLISSNCHVVDNQIFHIHAEGSGDNFHRRSISVYLSSLRVLPSNASVLNSQKKIVSWYGSSIPVPFDFFGRHFSIELNGIHSNLGVFLNVSETSLETNVSLTMV